MARYPDDPYDRLWSTWKASWWPVSTIKNVRQEESTAERFHAPSAVMQTAITPLSLNVTADIEFIEFSYTVRTNHVYSKPRYACIACTTTKTSLPWPCHTDVYTYPS